MQFAVAEVDLKAFGYNGFVRSSFTIICIRNEY
jgi:hypothetical protein